MDDALTIDPFNIAAEGTKYFDAKNTVTNVSICSTKVKVVLQTHL